MNEDILNMDNNVSTTIKTSEAYSEPSQTFKMELFLNIVKRFKFTMLPYSMGNFFAFNFFSCLLSGLTGLMLRRCQFIIL